MKKLIALTCLLFTIKANSQEVAIKKGTEFTPEENTEFNYYIGNDNSGVYMRRTRYKGKGTSYFIQKLDAKTLKSLFTADLSLEDKESPHSCYLLKDKILFFSTLYDGKDKKLLLRECSSVDGKSIGTVKQVASLPSDPFGVNGRNFFISFSPDTNKMVIVSEFQWPKKLQDVFADIYEYPGYKKLETKKLINTYGESGINSYNYRVDNTGKFFFLFNYMIDFEEEIAGKALATMPANEGKTAITKLPFEKINIQNGTFDLVNGKFVLCGLFKDAVTKKERKEGKEKNVGMYSFFIDPKTSEIISKGYDYFPADVKEKLNYKDGMVKADPAEKFYSFEDIFTINDNIYVVESHSYVISSDKYYTSYERELIVSKFNKDGKMEWMKIIPKFTANSLNSFNYIVKNNKVYLFYAEHPKNLENSTITEYDPKKYKDIKNYNGSVLVCTTFDESGKLERKEIFRNEGWCYDPISTNIYVEKDGLLLRMINQKKERYDIVSIK